LRRLQHLDVVEGMLMSIVMREALATDWEEWTLHGFRKERLG
jgi:hypothetical protein